MRIYEDNKLIEEAIKFLVTSIEKSGKNQKPVILHSIRVAIHLDKLGYARDVIIGAILHDLLEDTGVVKEEINSKFGERVVELVEANSFDEDTTGKTEQYMKLFEKCKKAGKDALVIKAADILDNSNYYNGNEQLIEKMRYFIEISEDTLKGEKVWKDLEAQYERVKLP